MESQGGDKSLPGPSAYVSFLLANAAREVTQLLHNYLSLGQYEAARMAFLQLLDLDRDQATKVLTNLLQIPHEVYVPICAHSCCL